MTDDAKPGGPCSCGKPEVCEWHYTTAYILTDNWNNSWPFGIKDDDWPSGECDAPCRIPGCTGYQIGPIFSPSRIPAFNPGDRVRVEAYGGHGVCDESHPRDRSAYPHVGQTGTVVKKVEDRLYAVEFEDGKTVGMYANELERIHVATTTTPVTPVGRWIPVTQSGITTYYRWGSTLP